MDFMVGSGMLKCRTICFGTQQRLPERITFCCRIFDSGFAVAVVVSVLRFYGRYIATRAL